MMVHVALWPSASCTLLGAVNVPPTHDQLPAVYPVTFVSDNVYVPALTSLSAPPAPEIGVSPAALSVKSDAFAVPPLSFVTVLTSFRCALWSLLLIVQL